MGKHKDKSHKRDKERHGESSSSSKRKRDSSSEEEEYEKMEKARLRDLRERDEFSERLKRRDKEKTKNVMDKTSKAFFHLSGIV
jgi:pre-mRNA-splicing factor ATP-dependent RNA helicase DHX16